MMTRFVTMSILAYKSGSIVIQFATLMMSSKEGIQLLFKSLSSTCQFN